MEDDLLDGYKTFRNFVRKLDFDDSMNVLWVYFNLVTVENFQLPSDIPTPPRVDGRPIMVDLQPWKLLKITEEVLIRQTEMKNQKSLKDWNSVAHCLNKLEDITREISEDFVNTDNVIHELYRIAHLQFPWQENRVNVAELSRYYYIYERLGKYFEEYYRLPAKNFFLAGCTFYGASLSRPGTNSPVQCGLKTVSDSDFARVLEVISLPKEEFPAILLAHQQQNENFFNSFSPLYRYPLIATEIQGQRVVRCPSSYLLFQRLTRSIYYDLIGEFGHGQFGKDFGAVFEQYIGEMLTMADKKNAYEIIDDSGDRSGSTVDWIMRDNDSAIFVECKAQRVNLEAKTALIDLTAKEKFLDNIAKHIVQAYKALNRYFEGKYPGLENDTSLVEISIVLCSLENWYLFGFENERLEEKVRTQLTQSELPADFVEKYPYFLLSAQELEQTAQILQTVNITEYFSGKVGDPEMKKWAFGSYISKQYPDEYSACKPIIDVFEKELNPEQLKE